MSRRSINSVEQLTMWHEHVCECDQPTTCITIFNRCIIKSKTYHSLSYTNRQSTISYFVQYFNDNQNTLFGSIELFFTYKGSSFALINYHSAKHLFSDVFRSTPYYYILSKCIYMYFYILQSKSSSFHYVPIQNILNLCIVFENYNLLIVTPISKCYEHG